MIDQEAPFIEEFKDSTMIRKKGAGLIVYLSSLVGPERLEAVFASFLDRWRHQPAPFPTATDFVEHLRTHLPSEYHSEISDIFEHITTWHLTAEKAVCEALANGQWKLTATVDAHKWRTGGWGRQTEVPMDTPVQLTAFTGRGFDRSTLLATETRRLPSGRSQITMQLNARPDRFGIDPYLLLPDPNPHDNLVSVEKLPPSR